MSSRLPLFSRWIARPALVSVTLGFGAWGLLALAPAASAQYYSAVDLTTLGYPINFSSPYGGINNAGQFADDNLLTGPNGLGPVTNLGTLNGSSVKAVCVNDAGEVAGQALVNGYVHAFVSGPQGTGPLKDLGSIGEKNYVYVSGINASGQVDGSYFLNGHLHGFLSEPGKGDALKDLGLVPGFDDISTSNINNAGQVTGTASSQSNPQIQHAFISGVDGNGPLRDLGTLGGNYSAGFDINASGQVAGESSLYVSKFGDMLF